MKLPIPIVASCDVLFIGGTTPAVREALEARAAGASVFLATPFSSFGEDLCLTLDLQGAAADAFRRAAGLDHFATPFEVKRTLDRWVIDAGIGFLFGMHPVRPLAGAEGSFAGWVFGTRSGFVAVKAKTVVDATSRLQALESAGVAMAPFQPGRRTVSHILAGGAAEPREGLRVEALPVRFPDGPDHDTQLFRASIEFDFTDDTPATCAAATAALRFASWCGRTRAMSAVPSFGFERRTAAPLAPCAERPLFLPVAGAGRAAAALAKRLPDTAASSLRAAGGAADAAPPAAGEEIVRKDPSCRFGDRPTVDFVLAGFPVFDEVDVLVVGGGTAGAPAAIAAARAGARTLCLDALHALGGCMTVGRTSSYYYGRRVGFTREVDDGVYAMDADPFWKREDPFFDGGWKEAWFLREAVRAGASVWFGTQAVAALVACGGRRVAGAVVAGPHGCGIVRARVVVDATGAADVAAAAGAGTSSGDLAVEPALQGAGIPPVRLYSTYTNTDYQFIVDQDVVDATRAFVMSRAKFTDVFDVCPNLNTRERRRIVGDLTLQPQDFFANRRYRDTINVAYSNFDTHGFIVHPLFMIRPTAHDGHLAAIPLRALLPRGLEGILSTGLGIAAHRDCMPLVRMQADVQNQGYAAGLVAAAAARNGCPLRALDLRPIQRELAADGHFDASVAEDVDVESAFAPDDPWRDAAALFVGDGSAARADLAARFAAAPDDPELALALAFTGDARGKALLAAAVRDGAWDDGWDYRGMGQFGPCMSRFDAKLIALSRIGGDRDAVLACLRSLAPEMPFSHFRAIGLALLANPDPAAAPDLERLLQAPGMGDHATTDFKKLIERTDADACNTSLRNSQLKELYLARALAACDPASSLARTTLAAYARGLDGAYVPFAAQGLDRTFHTVIA